MHRDLVRAVAGKEHYEAAEAARSIGYGTWPLGKQNGPELRTWVYAEGRHIATILGTKQATIEFTEDEVAA